LPEHLHLSCGCHVNMKQRLSISQSKQQKYIQYQHTKPSNFQGWNEEATVPHDRQMPRSSRPRCSAPGTGLRPRTLSDCPRRICSAMACCLQRGLVSHRGRHIPVCPCWSSLESCCIVPGKPEARRLGSGWGSHWAHCQHHSLDEEDDGRCWSEVYWDPSADLACLLYSSLQHSHSVYSLTMAQSVSKKLVNQDKALSCNKLMYGLSFFSTSVWSRTSSVSSISSTTTA